MCNTDGRRGFVDMLTTGTAGSIRIDTQIIFLNIHIQIFINIRHNIAGYKRSLSLSCRIKR